MKIFENFHLFFAKKKFFKYIAQTDFLCFYILYVFLMILILKNVKYILFLTCIVISSSRHIIHYYYEKWTFVTCNCLCEACIKKNTIKFILKRKMSKNKSLNLIIGRNISILLIAENRRIKQMNHSIYANLIRF